MSGPIDQGDPLLDQGDPLRPRQRPGVRIEAEAASWESVVFAISAGTAVRYLEVPAEQVEPFLENVDSGVLDDDLVALASTPTGAALNIPGRVRTLAAFDRMVRGAVARAERDPVSGELMGPGWRPRKRRRDDRGRSEDQPPESTSEPAAAPSASANAAAALQGAAVSVARAGPWSGPVVVAAAVAAVVVVAAAAVFAVSRSGGAPENQAGAVAAASTESSAAATSLAASSRVTTPAALSAAATSAAGFSTEAPASAAASLPAGSAASVGTSARVPGVPAAAHPIAGTYAVVRTITANDGNTNAVIGFSESFDLTITAACPQSDCAVSAKNWGTATVQGTSVKFSGTVSEPCEKTPGITVEDAWSVTFKTGPVDDAGVVRTLTGTGTVTVSALNGCNATIHPITWSYSATRTG